MLSFILPLSHGKDIYMALNILFPSIIEFFDLSQLSNLFIILNKNEVELFNQYMKNKNYIDQLKIKIIYESDMIDTTNIYNTYYLQMLLKLLIAKKIKTKYYMTLDSDVYFCKKCDDSYFFNKDKAYMKQVNINKKNKWISRVEKELDVEINIITNQTPFIFNTRIVKNMLTDINVPNLILKKNCSEYTLFLGYLIKNNLLDNYENKDFTVKPINYSVNKDIYTDNEILLNENFLLNENRVIGCIQSRINQHHKLVPIIKQYIPNISYNKPKIAILTVVSRGNYYKTYEPAFYTKLNYCKYYNYDFCFEIVNDNKYPRNKGWMKIYKLRQVIENYDYVFMSDADVVITNRDIMLEDIIYRYNLDEKLCLITEDYNSLNSGNIIWRNCPETIQFLDEIINHTKEDMCNEPYKLMGIYEQPCIIDLINKKYLNKINIVPQIIINSYPKIFGKKINKENERSIWSNGDFLIHFAGVNYNDKLWENFDIIKEVKKYVLIYKINIIKKEGRDYGLIY